MIINISYNTFWFISIRMDLSYNNECNRYQWPLLLTWINFNPNIDK